jgi:hypothetical protein
VSPLLKTETNFSELEELYLLLYKKTLHQCQFEAFSTNCCLYIVKIPGTVNREIFAALKVGEFAFFQLAVDKIRRLLQKFNG